MNTLRHPHYQTAKQIQFSRAKDEAKEFNRKCEEFDRKLKGKRILSSIGKAA